MTTKTKPAKSSKQPAKRKVVHKAAPAAKKPRFVKAVYYREDGTTMTVHFPKNGCQSKKQPEKL
jgi:hypothetical protein